MSIDSILRKYKELEQRITSVEDENREKEVLKLQDNYEGFDYETLLLDTSKSQVKFVENVELLSRIEENENERFSNLKKIRDHLSAVRIELIDKIQILDAKNTVEKQHQLDLEKLEQDYASKLEQMLHEKDKVEQDFSEKKNDLENRISEWENSRENKLKKEEDLAKYQYGIRMREIEDSHLKTKSQIQKEAEEAEFDALKEINILEKEMKEQQAEYDDACAYLEEYPALIEHKISEEISATLARKKDDYEFEFKKQEQEKENDLKIISIEIENLVNTKKRREENIVELAEKLDAAKIELNTLTQNTIK